MHIVRAPDVEATQAFLRHELATVRNRRSHIVQVVASCGIEYAGRAASTLDQGERLIIIKSDGTLLVHTSQKSKPVNWMPPGANTFTVGVDDGDVVLVAERRKPHHEVVRMRLLETHLLVAIALRDSEELVLRRTEGDLHELFFQQPQLLEPGMSFVRGEKRTRRGPVDLWGTDADGARVLVEVKRSKAGIAEATQLWRYVEMERSGRFAPDAERGAPETDHTGTDAGADSASGARSHERSQTIRGPRIRGILVAPGISDKALAMLRDHGLEHVNIDWDHLLAELERPRGLGQSTLGTFTASRAAGASEKAVATEPTRRTGRRRSA